MNGSGIIPMQYKVIVAVEQAAEKTAGGIVLPDNTKDRKAFEVTRGTIVAAGPAAFSDGDQYPKGTRVPQVGERIWFDKHAGHQMKGQRDSVTQYRILEDTDIVGIVENFETAERFVA